MKKTLIALAAVASTAAFAQNVTMYGVADLAIGKQGAADAQLLGNTAMNNGNSRFGLRGSEDLGGGLKASFNFEAGVNAETGATDANTFQRAAFVALDGGFGQIRMGRGLSVGWSAGATYDLTGTANYSVIGNQFGFTGGVRDNSEIRYTTPTMSGFSAALGMVSKGDNGGNAETNMNVIYKQGPIAAAFAYSKTKGAEKNTSIGASYDFGVAKVAASYQDPAGAAKGYTVGVSAPVGPMTLTLDVGKETGITDATDYVLEAKYPLSKRTFVYGATYRDGSAATDKTSYAIGVRHNF